MEIEAGSEWFHRERLTVVEVDQVDDGHVTFMTDDMTGREHVPDFLRDYARNEPVTLGLLERMGWGVNHNSGVATCEVKDQRLSRKTWTLWHDANGLKLICFFDEGPQPMLGLPATATLRDLLLALRVFGVQAPIPAAAG